VPAATTTVITVVSRRKTGAGSTASRTAPVRALRDRVPDRQAVRRKMETVGTWQRIFLGKRVGECRDWLFEQVKDRPVGGVAKGLRQSFEFVPGSVR
jgi:hypothetical protein